MKVCFTSDLHGSEELYAQLLTYIREQHPDLLLLGGDQCHPSFGESGVLAQRAWFGSEFKEFLVATSPICRILWTTGNHDLYRALDGLANLENDGLIVNADGAWADIGESWSIYAVPYGLPSYDWPVSDWKYPHGYQARRRITDLLEKIPMPPPSAHSILLTHYPPYRSRLDNTIYGPIGSLALATYLAKNHFDIVCSGHIHEAPYLSGTWARKFKGSTQIQCGKAFEMLHAVLFDTQNVDSSLTHTIFGHWRRCSVPNGMRRRARKDLIQHHSLRVSDQVYLFIREVLMWMQVKLRPGYFQHPLTGTETENHD